MFHAKAEQNLHIGLFSEKLSSSYHRAFYEIVIGGGWGSKEVYIRTGGMCCRKQVTAYNTTIMDPTEFLPFWVSWTDNIIAVGNGEIVGEDMLSWYNASAFPMAVNFIAISSYQSVVLDFKYFNGE